ncbi:MAG: thiamine phosphate synthase, partial [Mariprofundaceae bacterium]
MAERDPAARRIRGIYGILPPDLPDTDMLARARAALEGGVRILQLRDKKAGFAKRLKRMRQLVDMASDFEAMVFANDRLQLARDAGAHGVHLGRSDLEKSIAAIRAEAGETLIIGVSCQGDAAFARHVLTEGADYVSFGAVFPTRSKREAVPIGLPRLRKARQLFPGANICAIGGITLDTLPAVRRAGADAAAVISALFDASD